MTMAFRTLRLRLATLETSPLGTLLLRLGLTFLILFPWGTRFVPVSFRVEEVDPVLLEACRAEGLDLLNPALWPTRTGVWARWGLVMAGVGLGWWLLSRLIRGLQRRWGLGVAAFPLLAVLGWVGWSVRGWAPSLRLFLDQSGGVGRMAVWGGWMEGPIWGGSEGIFAALSLLLMVLLFLEGVLLFTRTQALLSQAQALALRSHLAPHFLYNALNTLHGLVEEDPRGAQAGMERLGRLLRTLLERRDRVEVSLGEELAFVADYLSLERARLGDRLQVVQEVPEEALGCPVPVLGLQVLVENAVKHAIAPRGEGGTLRIRVRRMGGDLEVAVLDPGEGLGSGQGMGLALDNLRSRLRRPSDLVLERTPEGHCARFRVRVA